MANKKINELSVRTPSLSDLMLVGDPSTGYSYKATISSLSTLLEANIALNDLSDVVITSVANGNLLAYNGTNWVNRTLGSYLGGSVTQYVRGDGTLGDFSGSGGGGGASVSYYLNGSVNQGTFGATTYYEMNKSPIVGTGTNFTINANGYIASFITDAGDPALLKIPGGNWNLEFYFSASSSGGTPSFYVELYKYDGTTFTLITSNSASPEGITNGTAIDAYFTSLSVPETVLTLTDRLAIRVYVTHSGRTITLHTENSHLCQIITTFTTGLTALNNLTAQVQFFATGTSGTDFAISSTTATHTFNLPTASATNRGALSSADWTTFNGKVGGSGTTNYVSKFTASGTIGNSLIYDNGVKDIGINTTSPGSLGSNITTLSINGVSTAFTGGIWLRSSDNGVRSYIYGTSGLFIIGSETAQPMTFQTSASERMRLTTSGRLLIGTSTESTYELDLVGDFRSTLDANINGLTVGKGLASIATNTALGVSALGAITTGADNTAVGNSSFRITTTGSSNTGIGYATGFDNVSGTNNVYIGDFAGRSVTTSQNTFVGSQAGRLTTSGGDNTFVGAYAGYGVTTGVYNTIIGRLNTGITTGSYNTIIGASVTGLSASLSNTIILADGQGNQRLYINSSGNVGIGTTSPSYLLDVNGTARVSGTELRLDNGTTGTINLYSNTPEIRFLSSNPTAYRLYRNGTEMILNSGGSIFLQIGGNDSYYVTAALGHNWKNPNSGGSVLARLDTGGSLSIGNSGTAANASSILDLTSTTKGLLPPRMTTTQKNAITSPATGLVVYDTTLNKLSVYTGAGWETVTSV